MSPPPRQPLPGAWHGRDLEHDLALAESEELVRNADLVHFREHFEYTDEGKPKMTFDYQLRPGIATTTNALRILEVIEMPV